MLHSAYSLKSNIDYSHQYLVVEMTHGFDWDTL